MAPKVGGGLVDLLFLYVILKQNVLIAARRRGDSPPPQATCLKLWPQLTMLIRMFTVYRVNTINNENKKLIITVMQYFLAPVPSSTPIIYIFHIFLEEYPLLGPISKQPRCMKYQISIWLILLKQWFSPAMCKLFVLRVWTIFRLEANSA